jgi:hypothetical protein
MAFMYAVLPIIKEKKVKYLKPISTYERIKMSTVR